MRMKLEQFVVKENDRVISSLWIYTVQLPSRYLAVIEEVWTDEDHRRKGHATANIKKAIEFARSEGCTCVELTVREDKPEIQAFYQSLGFFDRQNRAYRLTL
jgi:ribosomal protein S18 acetylase RimI-like enzyme